MTRLTETELAERWAPLTTRTLQNWRRDGTGPAFVRIGPRSVFYRLDDIEAYERTSRVDPTEPAGWRSAMTRAASALDLLSRKAKTPKAAATLTALRDELRGLLS